jgi:hypothetical protein
MSNFDDYTPLRPIPIYMAVLALLLAIPLHFYWPFGEQALLDFFLFTGLWNILIAIWYTR